MYTLVMVDQKVHPTTMRIQPDLFGHDLDIGEGIHSLGKPIPVSQASVIGAHVLAHINPIYLQKKFFTNRKHFEFIHKALQVYEASSKGEIRIGEEGKDNNGSTTPTSRSVLQPVVRLPW